MKLSTIADFKNNLSYLIKTDNLKCFFIGKFLADIAKWIQITTIPWLVYSITGSSLQLGFVAFLEYILILFCSPLIGTIIKQYSRKKIIILINFIFLILFISLATLYFLQIIKIWHIYITATITGLLTAFDLTTRQVLIGDIVSKEKIVNALGFNSLLSNISRFMAPAIAGFVIYFLNEGYCFVLNIIVSVFAILSFFYIQTGIKTEDTNHFLLKKYITDFKQSVLFLKKDKNIKYMLLLIAIVGFSMAAPVVLMPVFANDIYKTNSTGFGILLSSRGLGALLATFVLISRKDSDNLKNSAFKLSFTITLFIILFGILNNIYISFILFMTLGYCMVLNTGCINSFIQISSSKENRPILMGFFISCFLGFVPIGNLFAGYLASKFTPQIACIVIGAISLISIILLRKKIIS